MRTHPRSGNVSLARALSKLGYCSRSQAAALIREGRVRMGGKTILNPAFRCLPERTRIAVDGHPVAKKENIYIILNKPVGVITTRSDERARKTVYHLLGEVGKWIFPVGRLDKDTSGLLLLTNDNRLGERLTNPDGKIVKKYIAVLDREFVPEDAQKFESGMTIGGTELLPARVRIISPKKISISIREGKNRQVRRMFESSGYRVLSLARIAIGDLVLSDLGQGKWRFLTRGEVRKLMQT